MKGIVFTEFLEMVEESFGFVTAEHIVSSSALPSGGTYTAVGTYHHAEMVSLVSALSQETDMAVPALLKEFGKYLFPKFVAGYGGFFEGVSDPFDFLGSLDQYIHVEVKKLYPDAELPRFVSSRPSPDMMTMEYRSDRGLADFAEGLIEGCIAHFGQNITLQREDMGPHGTHSHFVLTKS